MLLRTRIEEGRHADRPVEVDHRAHRLAKPAPARQFVGSERVKTPIFRREQQFVRRLRVEGEGGAVPFLELQRIGGGKVDMPLHRADPAALRQDDGDRLALDHRLQRDIACRRRFLDTRPPRAQRRIRAVAIADLLQVALHPPLLLGGIGEQPFQLGPLLVELVALAADFELLQPPQTAQPHVEDRLGLPVGQAEFRDHHLLGLVLGADDLDHPIEVEIRDQVAIEQLDPVGDLAEAMPRAPVEHDELMLHPRLQRPAQRHDARRPLLVEHVEVEADARFEVRKAEQAVHQHLRVDGAAARLEHDADLGIRFVADVGQDREFLVVDQPRDLLDQLALLHAVGDLADDDLPAAALLALDVPARTDTETAAPGRIAFRDHRRRIDDDAAGRKVRPLHIVEHRGVGAIGLVDQHHRRIQQLGGIVRGNARRHADRDPGGAIGEQIGEQAREQLGLLLLAIIGRAIGDGVFVQPVHQVDRNLRQPRLGVAIGGGVIAVDIAEIALPIDQRIAQREILGEADHRVIDRLVAMRVILTDHVTDDARAFLIALRGIELQQPHRPQQPSMHRLQAVAHVGQRARRDRRQRIDEVAVRQRGVEGRVEHAHRRVLKIGGHIGNDSRGRPTIQPDRQGGWRGGK